MANGLFGYDIDAEGWYPLPKETWFDESLLAPQAGGTVSGTLAWTEADDTTAIAGAVKVTASLGWTETDDVCSISGALAVTSALAWTEADDVSALAGAVTVSGGLSWTESDDTTAITGTVGAGASVDGTLAWTEADDAFAMLGTAEERVAPSGSQFAYRGRTRKEIEEAERLERITLGIIPDDAAIAKESLRKAESDALEAIAKARESERRIADEVARLEEQERIEEANRKRDEAVAAAMFAEELLVEYRKISVQMDKYRRAAILLLLA